MIPKIKPFFEPIVEAQVQALEARVGARLPPDYRDFLLEHNGGIPKPNLFLISTVEGESNLSILFGITSEDAYDLWTNALNAYDDMDRTFLPIGMDPGGNQIYLSLHPDTYGQILFRDHEQPAPDCLHPIAASFTELLQNLH